MTICADGSDAAVGATIALLLGVDRDDVTQVQRLTGGISASTHAALVHERRRVVLRTPRSAGSASSGALAHTVDEWQRHFEVLRVAAAARVPVPAPIAVDTSMKYIDRPALVLEYCEGQPCFQSDAADVLAGRFADLLARVHSTPLSDVEGLGLPTQSRVVDRVLRAAPDIDIGIADLPVHQTLLANQHRLASDDPVLLHGDCWPGNVIEGPDGLVLIDWEDASIGPPAADVSVTRLDLWWAFGRHAAATFTTAYRSRRPIDPHVLATWDLITALRPGDELSAWGTTWPDAGRPDVTVSHLRTVLRAFVERAIAVLAQDA